MKTKSVLKVSLLLYICFCLVSCQTTQVGIGSSRNHKAKEELTAYKIDYKTGLKMAHQACTTAFDQAEVTGDGSGIRVYHEGNWLTEGTAGAIIYPLLVRDDENKSRTGIIFKIEAFGEGHNYSLVPGFMTNKFFKELDKVSKKETIQTINFNKYTILEDISIADKVDAQIPTTTDGYKTFLNRKQYLHPYEGIWSSDDGAYVLGVLYDPDNPQFKYKGFIISAEMGTWKQGEIKVKWHSLEDGDLCLGDWYAGNKQELTIVFKVSKKLIISTNAPKNYGQIVLLKIYPESTTQEVERSGTGFAITEDGYIATAYHVIKNSKTIKVYFSKDSFVSARVIHSDPMNDLALLKIENSTPNFLQIAPMRSAEMGNKVFTVGFPVSSILGQEAKYTEGVISSISGLEDASSYLQITVPVQPGNSGGSLVNEKGEVVGIVTSTAAILPFIEESGTLPQNINWAVKADYLRPLIDLPKTEQKGFNREELINHVKKSTFFIKTE